MLKEASWANCLIRRHILPTGMSLTQSVAADICGWTFSNFSHISPNNCKQMKIIRDYAADNSAQLISSDNHITVFYTSIYPYRQWEQCRAIGFCISLRHFWYAWKVVLSNPIPFLDTDIQLPVTWVNICN